LPLGIILKRIYPKAWISLDPKLVYTAKNFWLSFKKKSLRGAVKDPEMTCAGFFFCVSY